MTKYFDIVTIEAESLAEAKKQARGRVEHEFYLHYGMQWAAIDVDRVADDMDEQTKSIVKDLSDEEKLDVLEYAIENVVEQLSRVLNDSIYYELKRMSNDKK